MTARTRAVIRVGFLVAVAGLLAASIVLLRDGDGATSEDDGRPDVRDALLDQEQRRLRFCVQAVDFESGPVRRAIPGAPALEEQARNSIQDALKRVAKDPLWERADRDTLEPPLVDIGCPSPPVMLVGGEDARELGRRVWEPSQYGVFVFILPDDMLAQFTEWGSPAASEEFMAGGDQAWGMTLGVYLTQSQLEDSEYLTDVMIEAVGLKAFEKRNR